MSIIASTYNTGTGLSSSVAEEQLPVVVNDLTVNGNLTVIESTILNGPTTVTTDLVVGQTTTTENIIVNNNIIIDNGVGQNNTSLFKLPLTNGTNDQVLTITNDTTNPILTEWKDVPLINDYVQYNTVTEQIKRNFDLVISDINNLVLTGKIGKSINTKFQLPTNTATTTGDVLTIKNGSTNETEWKAPIIIDNFVRYNTDSYKLKRVVSSIEYDINKLSLNASIGLNDLEQFQLPFNTSSTTVGSGTYFLTIANNTKNSFWTVPFANVAYDGSSYVLSSETAGAGILPITNLQLTTIGQLNQKFQLPFNTSSTTVGSGTYFLTIANNTKNSYWAIPFGNVAYDGSSYKFSTNNPSIVDITNIALDGQIGKTNQLFTLPSNTATAPSTTASISSVLTLSDSITRTTTWTTIPNITSYTNYNATTNILSLINPIGTTTPITALVLPSIGASILQKFALPTNTSTASTGTVLTLGASNLTSWSSIPTITNYLNYDSTNKTLISNVSGTPTTVIDLVMSGSIGLSTPQKFILPSNSSTASVNSVLTLTNTSTKTTSWVSIPSAITNYLNYDSTNKTLISNVSGTPTTVSDLVMSGSIGLSTPEKFILPSNSSTTSVNSVLTLSNISTKATTWVSPTSLINNYVNYNSLNNKLASVISGTASDITTVVVNNIGKEAQTFVLPSNTSTTTVNSVLTLTNTTTKTSEWQVIPTQISNYVSYDTGTQKLLNNVNSIISNIDNLLINTVIKTPSIQSTSVNNPLTIANNQTGSSARLDIGVNSARTGLINIGTGTTTGVGHTINIGTGTLTPINIKGTTTITDDLVANTSIGKSLIEKFVLPSNSSSAPLNSFLSLTNTSTKTTSWVSIPSAITNYVSYNTSNFKLINNNGGTLTNINTIVTDTVTASTIQTGLGGSVSGAFGDFGYLRVAPLTVTDSTYIGYTYGGSVSSSINYSSGSTRAVDITGIVSLVNGGHYMIKYDILINSGTTSRSLTSITHGLSNSGSTLTTVNTIKYEPQCCTNMRLNTGTEIINDRLYQGTVFFKYDSANAYTIFSVLNFSGTGTVTLDITFTAIRII